MAGPVVITGGGTGGHAFPMVAIADALRAGGLASSDLRLVGSRRAQDARFFEGDVAVTLLGGRGLRRSPRPRDVVANAAALGGLLTASVRALILLRRWRASTVVSVGGYASLAVSLAAWCWRTPLVLVEFDVVPGAAQRLFRRYAAARCRTLTSGDEADGRVVVTGAPLRASIEAVDRSPATRAIARAALRPPITPQRTVIVVMTGSLGATKVNRAVRELADAWSTRDDVTILHVTGRRDFPGFRDPPATSGLDYRVLEFGDMPKLWSVADLAICRAGAITVAELTTLAIPSILVPLPGSPMDHQVKNAQSVVVAGGARLVLDEDCDALALAANLEVMMATGVLAAMAGAAATLGRRDGAARVAAVVLGLRGRA